MSFRKVVPPVAIVTLLLGVIAFAAPATANPSGTQEGGGGEYAAENSNVAPEANAGPVSVDVAAVAGANRLVIVYDSDVSERDQFAVIEESVSDVAEVRPLGGGAVAVALNEGVSVGEIADLVEDPSVRYVEEDLPLHLTETVWDPDTSSSLNWGMKGVRSVGVMSPEVHGANVAAAWGQGVTGSRDVYVGVIDSGIDVDHPELKEQIWVNESEVPGNGIDDDGNGYIDDVNGWNVLDDNGDVVASSSSESHGTRVTGTIAALGGNGVGSTGVAWNVGVVPARAFSPTGQTFTSHFVEGINYLVELKKSKGINLVAINASLGGGGFSYSARDAIRSAGDADILVVTSAGNEGQDSDVVGHYPSSYDCSWWYRDWDCLIAVGAHTEEGPLASFSNHGKNSVDISAPGVNVLTTSPFTTRTVLANGTSLSAPYVTGAIALCASVNPSLSARQMRAALFESAKPSSHMAERVATGGVLDVGALVGRCENTDATVGAFEGVSLLASTRAKVEGYVLPAEGMEFSLTDLRVSVDGEEAAIVNGRVTQFESGRVQFAGEVPVRSGNENICVNEFSGRQIVCTDFFVPESTDVVGEMTVVPRNGGYWGVTGWALDPLTPQGADPNSNQRATISLYVNGALVESSPTGRHGSARFPSGSYTGWDSTGRGYEMWWRVPAGKHTACVVVSSPDGKRSTQLGCLTHRQVSSDLPLGSLDQVVPLPDGQLRVTGWAFDPNEDEATNLHVYVNNEFAGSGVTGTPRNDVMRVYPGNLTDPGYSFVVPVNLKAKNNTVCVYAINKGAGTTNPLLGCRTVNAPSGNPFGSFDSLRSIGGGSVRLQGWALDPDTVKAVRVHVYVNGRFRSAQTANAFRGDVGRVHRGYGDNHGYDFTLNNMRGNNTVCVYTINVGAGTTNPLLGCRTVNVPSGNPFGAVDVARQEGLRGIRVSGWTVDPDVTSPIKTHVYVNGWFKGQTTADLPRPDVQRALTLTQRNYGSSALIQVKRSGAYNVCVYAINVGAGTANPLLGCRRVIVE